MTLECTFIRISMTIARLQQHCFFKNLLQAKQIHHFFRVYGD